MIVFSRSLQDHASSHKYKESPVRRKSEEEKRNDYEANESQSPPDANLPNKNNEKADSDVPAAPSSPPKINSREDENDNSKESSKKSSPVQSIKSSKKESGQRKSDEYSDEEELERRRTALLQQLHADPEESE